MKKKIRIYVIILLVLAVCLANSYKSSFPQRLLEIIGAEAKVTSLSDGKTVDITGSFLWQDVTGFNLGNMRSFGLEKEMIKEEFEIEFIKNGKVIQKGIIYNIEIKDFKNLEGFTEMAKDENEINYKTFYNELFDNYIVLKINNHFIKIDQIFFDRIQEVLTQK